MNINTAQTNLVAVCEHAASPPRLGERTHLARMNWQHWYSVDLPIAVTSAAEEKAADVSKLGWKEWR